MTKREDEAPLTSASAESSSAYHGNFVDARTVALTHTRALQKEEASGNRFIVSAGVFCWQDVCEFLYFPIPFFFQVDRLTDNNALLSPLSNF